MPQQNLIFRLSIVKYLYKIAFNQSNKTLPFAAFSILSFHDAVEMFLVLLAEYKNIRTDNVNFMQYWQIIPELSYQEPMRRFNRLRRELKHQGIIPSEIEIETSRNIITHFFVENCRTFFEVSFDEISTIDLIKYDETRSLLSEANQLLNNNEISGAIDKAALAFHKCFSEYYLHKDTKRNYNRKIGFSFRDHHRMGREIGNAFKDIMDSIKYIQYQLKLLGLGLDLNKFEKFNHLTPIIYFTQSGNHTIHRKGLEYEKGDVIFCIDFVIECALNLQQIE